MIKITVEIPTEVVTGLFKRIAETKVTATPDISSCETSTVKKKAMVIPRSMKGMKQRAVFQIDPKSNKVIKEYPSISAAAKAIDVSIGAIVRCCNDTKQRWTSKGYKWAYKEGYKSPLPSHALPSEIANAKSVIDPTQSVADRVNKPLTTETDK